MLLTVDGISLQDMAWNIQSRGGRWRTPEKVTSNVKVPGRSGAIWTSGKTYAENTITLGMWVRGCNSNGVVPTDRTQLQKLRENIDRLTRLFGKSHGLLEVVQTDDSSVSRRCYAECVMAVDFTSFSGARAEFAAELIIPSAFWEDVDPVTYVSSSGITSGTNFGLTGLSGGTAVIEDAVITLRGAATNPKITDVLNGTYVQLNTTVVSAQDWVVDNSVWSSFNNGINNVVYTVHQPGVRLLPLQPNPDTGDVIVKVEGSGFNANTRLTVSGRRKWLIA